MRRPVRCGSRARTVPCAVRACGLPLLSFATSGAGVTAVRSRPASTLEGQRAWMLDLKPNEQAKTPAVLLDQYVGELPRELGDSGASQSAFAGLQAYEHVTWPQWLRSR